jgi:anthranilate/para-aminobenzoate synthase component I
MFIEPVRLPPVNAIERIRLDSSAPGALWTCNPGPASLLLRCDARTHLTELRDLRQDRITRTWTDPLAALEWLGRHLNDLNAHEAADARWIGYLGYDLGRLFESLSRRDPGPLPLFAFTFHATSRNPKPASPGPQRELAQRVLPVLSTAPSLPLSPQSSLLSTSNFTRAQYLGAVRKALDYIAGGDIFQVNLAQRFTALLVESPSVIYERLQHLSPARYGAYLSYSDHALLCNSPELFLKVARDDATGRRIITTRPIKGTRPVAPGMEAQLRDSLKDQAELNMIIDLERNDLGRVCEIGSVRVTQPRTIERHPTVYQGAATIAGVLREDVTFVDLVRATFPGGSITGAPKIRAMQIIDELEPDPRGAYCGAIGYLASDGTMEFNIAIRTLIIHDRQVHIPVGGGIVADSDPASEFEETLVKARALFAALGIASPASQLSPG